MRVFTHEFNVEDQRIIHVVYQGRVEDDERPQEYHNIVRSVTRYLNVDTGLERLEVTVDGITHTFYYPEPYRLQACVWINDNFSSLFTSEETL